jgi:hypothetical protein
MEETNNNQVSKTIYENPLIYVGGVLFFCSMAAQAPFDGINGDNLNYVLLTTVVNYFWFAFVALIVFGISLMLGKSKTFANYLKIFCWTTVLLTAVALQSANNQRLKSNKISLSKYKPSNFRFMNSVNKYVITKI